MINVVKNHHFFLPPCTTHVRFSNIRNWWVDEGDPVLFKNSELVQNGNLRKYSIFARIVFGVIHKGLPVGRRV